ncbi:MAG: flagellar hook-basal body complex protein FliE [Bryobacterales bacterium]|nr:flagellar hook-basal body complex protein FliE [Bryobacterales bacterium]
MSSPISGLNSVNLPIPAPAGPAAAASGGDAFRALLGNAIGSVEQSRAAAHTSIEKFLAGENEELHQTVMDVQKAELSLDLFLQMRNKVIQAYQEVMRMQL